MAANYLFGDEGIAAAADGAAEDLRLLRRYEPVLRFTRGELFPPMAVPDYLATLAGLETSAGQLRQRRRVLAAEREALARASQLGLPPEDPHAHLRHRAVPNVDPIRTRKRVLQTWSTISASFLMAGLAVIVLGQGGALLPALAVLAMGMLCVEAFARGHLVRFALAILAAAAIGVVAWVAVLAVLAAVGNWRAVVAGLLALAALVLLVANIRDFFAKR